MTDSESRVNQFYTGRRITDIVHNRFTFSPESSKSYIMLTYVNNSVSLFISSFLRDK